MASTPRSSLSLLATGTLVVNLPVYSLAAILLFRMQQEDLNAWWKEASAVISLTVLFTMVTVFAARATYRRWRSECEAMAVLQASEAFRRTLIEFSPAFFVAIGADGATRMMNPAMYNALGYTASEVVGRDYLKSFVPESDRERLADVFRQLVHANQPTVNENRILCKDGRALLVEWHGVPVFKGTELDYFIGVGIDVTERKRAEEALRDSESRLRGLSDNLPGGMVYQLEMDPDGGRRFRYVSAGVEKLHEVGPEVVLQDAEVLYAHIIDADRQLVLERETQAMETLTPFAAEVRVRMPSGNMRWSFISSAPRQTPDGQTVWDGLEMDVTERKTAEEEVRRLNAELEQHVERRTAQLASVNSALNEFAYVVSHDLKAPLAAVNRLAHWICEDYASKLDEEGKRRLDLIRDRVKRMHDLIEGVLTYSRIGRTEETRTPVDLDTLVHELVEGLAPPSNLRVVMDTHLPVVTADRTRMEQVFQNLVGNAIRYMDKSDGLITIGCDDCGDRWRFHVDDNGPGIDPKYHERIFRIFQTLASSEQKDSTGVGLAVVKKIVEQYGGQVDLDSALGRGSRFSFTLPK